MGIVTVKLHTQEAIKNAEKYKIRCKKKQCETDYAYTVGKIAAYKEILEDIEKEKCRY